MTLKFCPVILSTSNIDSVAVGVHDFSVDSQNLYSSDLEAYVHFRYLRQINLPN